MTQFYKHPHFENQLEHWERYRDLYEGKHQALIQTKYLWLHEFEANEIKAGGSTTESLIARTPSLRFIREQRTRYQNYFKTIINRYVSLIFKSAPDLEDAISQLGEDEMNNVDGEGTTLVNFIKNKVAPAYFLYGAAGVLTDSPKGTARNKAEEKELGLRPYWTMLTPFEIVDWAVDYTPGKGKRYKWIRTEYTQLKDRSDPSEEPKAIIYSNVYKLDGSSYTIDKYTGGELSQYSSSDHKDWQYLETVPVGNDFEELPMAVISSESWMHDVGERALLLYNLESALDNQLNYQAFQRIIAAGEFDPQDSVVMNEATVTCIKRDAQVTVVEPTNPIALKERIGSVAAGMFQVAFHKSRVLPLDSKDVESADTQKESKEEFLACLQNASDTIEQTVEKMLYDFAKFKGLSDYKADISFNFDVTVEDVNEELSWIQAFYEDIRKHEKWYKATMKRVAQRQGFAEDDDIIKEIESAQLDPVEREGQQQQDVFAGLVGE